MLLRLLMNWLDELPLNCRANFLRSLRTNPSPVCAVGEIKISY